MDARYDGMIIYWVIMALMLLLSWLYVIFDNPKKGKNVVHIKRFVEKNGEWSSEITSGTYNDVYAKIRLADFTWKYIPEVGSSGWVQANMPAKPPKPYIIASEGMLKEADKILLNK